MDDQANSRMALKAGQPAAWQPLRERVQEGDDAIIESVESIIRECLELLKPVPENVRVAHLILEQWEVQVTTRSEVKVYVYGNKHLYKAPYRVFLFLQKLVDQNMGEIIKVGAQLSAKLRSLVNSWKRGQLHRWVGRRPYKYTDTTRVEKICERVNGFLKHLLDCVSSETFVHVDSTLRDKPQDLNSKPTSQVWATRSLVETTLSEMVVVLRHPPPVMEMETAGASSSDKLNDGQGKKKGQKKTSSKKDTATNKKDTATNKTDMPGTNKKETTVGILGGVGWGGGVVIGDVKVGVALKRELAKTSPGAWSWDQLKEVVFTYSDEGAEDRHQRTLTHMKLLHFSRDSRVDVWRQLYHAVYFITIAICPPNLPPWHFQLQVLSFPLMVRSAANQALQHKGAHGWHSYSAHNVFDLEEEIAPSLPIASVMDMLSECFRGLSPSRELRDYEREFLHSKLEKVMRENSGSGARPEVITLKAFITQAVTCAHEPSPEKTFSMAMWIQGILNLMTNTLPCPWADGIICLVGHERCEEMLADQREGTFVLKVSESKLPGNHLQSQVSLNFVVRGQEKVLFVDAVEAADLEKNGLTYYIKHTKCEVLYGTQETVETLTQKYPPTKALNDCYVRLLDSVLRKTDGETLRRKVPKRDSDAKAPTQSLPADWASSRAVESSLARLTVAGGTADCRPPPLAVPRDLQMHLSPCPIQLSPLPIQLDACRSSVGSTVNGSPVGSTVSGSCVGSTVSGSPVDSTVNGSPVGSTVSGSPVGSTVNGSCVGSTVNGSCVGSTVNGSPVGSTVNGSPVGSTVNGSCVGSTVNGSPVGSTIPVNGSPVGSTIPVNGSPVGSTIPVNGSFVGSTVNGSPVGSTIPVNGSTVNGSPVGSTIPVNGSSVGSTVSGLSVSSTIPVNGFLIKDGSGYRLIVLSSVPSALSPVANDTAGFPLAMSASHSAGIPVPMSASDIAGVPVAMSASHSAGIPVPMSASDIAGVPVAMSASHSAGIPVPMSASDIAGVPVAMSASHSAGIPVPMSASDTAGIPVPMSVSDTAGVPVAMSASHSAGIPVAMSASVASDTAGFPVAMSASDTAGIPVAMSASVASDTAGFPVAMSASHSAGIPVAMSASDTAGIPVAMSASVAGGSPESSACFGVSPVHPVARASAGNPAGGVSLSPDSHGPPHNPAGGVSLSPDSHGPPHNPAGGVSLSPDSHGPPHNPAGGVSLSPDSHGPPHNPAAGVSPPGPQSSPCGEVGGLRSPRHDPLLSELSLPSPGSPEIPMLISNLTTADWDHFVQSL